MVGCWRWLVDVEGGEKVDMGLVEEVVGGGKGV